MVSGNPSADRAVELFLPVHDPAGLAPGAAAAPEVFAPVFVKDHADSGRIVRYRLTRRRFGSWTPDLEFAWNRFQLQVNWLFSASLPDTAGMGGDASALYERIKGTDRFTRYYDSAAAPAMWNAITTTTRPGAIGIMVRTNSAGDTILIDRVVAGSPADRAALVRGMAIVAVDDSAVTGDSALDRFIRLNAGDSGSSVRLTVVTPAGESRVVHLTRVPVAFPTVLVDSLGGAGYIAILGFTPHTTERKSTWTEFRDALEATRRSPVTILDLRGNPGGSLDEAMRMCDEILPAGAVIIRQEQRRFDDLERVPLVTALVTRASSGGLGERSADGAERRYLLLADTGSASAAEIFIVSLREGADTPLMGGSTFGKGVGQIVRPTPGGGLALITFLKFTSAGGLDYHGKGIKPDYADTAVGDELLAHAVARATAMAEAGSGQGGGGGAGGAETAGAAEKGASAESAALRRRALRNRIGAAEWNRKQALDAVRGKEALFAP